jgi:hypothetical protein
LGRALPHVLLAVAAIELAVYRLAIPALVPSDGEAPPIWHAVLTYVGLFLFYFATALGLAIVVRQLVLFARREHPYGTVIGTVLVVTGAGVAAYAVKAMLAVPSEDDTMMLELFFTASLFVVVIGQLRPGGDMATKIGLFFLAAPLLVHFYRDAAVQWVYGPEALWEGVADRVDAYGQWSLVLAALMSPYCFAPRPFSEAAGKLAPLAIGTFVGLVGALVMRQSYEVGYLLAKRGLGIDLGAGAPTSQIALYLIALGSITWTFTACVTAPAPGRRRIGIGLGLIVASGYAFAWPLQYVVGLVGFLTISDGAREVADQERAARKFAAARFRAPPIRPDAWHSYIGSLVSALRARSYHASTVSVEDREEPAVLAPQEGEKKEAPPPDAGGVSRTHVLLLEAAPCPIRLVIERHEGSIRVMEVVCGRDPRELGEPAWTMEARSESRFASGHHPSPPAIRAPQHRTGDAEFDRRFKLKGAEAQSAALLDDGLRARAVALLDGWMAYWPEAALIYQLCPGRGTPLDTPIPITQLAFGGAGPATPDRMVTTLELVAAIAGRVFASSWTKGEAADPLDALPAAEGSDRYGGEDEPEEPAS